MFNTILSSFTGFFSRAFWFGCFLPVAVVLSLHLVIGQAVFPDTIKLLDWITGALGEKLTTFSIGIFATIVLAYVLAAFVPLMRSILDGTSMPDSIHDSLRLARASAWAETRRRADAARTLFGEFDALRERQKKAPVVAPPSGEVHAGLADPELIKKAAEKIDQWSAEMARLELKLDSAKAACEALAKALESVPADPNAAVDAKLRERLADCSRRIRVLLKASSDEARYRFDRYHARKLIDLLPTRVADARNSAERYSKDTYGVEFDFIWPRIQAVLQQPDAAGSGADSYGTYLSDAQSQVNFAVLAFMLAFTVPAFWLPVIFCMAGSLWLFLAIGLLSPIVLLLLYELIVQSQIAFGESVKATIDKSRLDVLTGSLLQPRPTTLEVERQLWKGVKAATEPLNQINLTYVDTRALANEGK